MSAIIDRLRSDHATVGRLLDLLDEQVREVREAERADFVLMRDILGYVSRYPDAVHQVALEKLLARDAGSQTFVERLQRDQRMIASKAAKILDEVGSVVDGSMVPRERVAALATEFLAAYRAHLEFEDGELLPLVEQTLTDDDWSAVASWLEASRDPVFARILEDDFRALYEYIGREST